MKTKKRAEREYSVWVVLNKGVYDLDHVVEKALGNKTCVQYWDLNPPNEGIDSTKFITQHWIFPKRKPAMTVFEALEKSRGAKSVTITKRSI